MSVAATAVVVTILHQDISTERSSPAARIFHVFRAPRAISAASRDVDDPSAKPSTRHNSTQSRVRAPFATCRD